MSKKYNWRVADWTNKDDFTVAEVLAVEDGKKIPLVTHKASTESPFYYVTQGQRRSVVLNMNKSEVK
tara:strand:+ start:504 stop:704 length:201 start_codon:yes stop_codon:yes gene_type:complete